MMFYLFDRNNKHRYTCKKSFKPKHEEINLVTGPEKVEGSYDSCSVFRIGKSEEGNCGKEAYYWEPKNKRDLFKYMKKVDHEANQTN
jgi:hypothetical protein